jgi:universal stress protein E
VSNYQRVLVPVDFSDCSAELVRHAAQLARPHGAELVLFHAFELPVGLKGHASVVGSDGVRRPIREQLRAEAHERMEPLLAEGRAAGLSVTSHIAEGPAATTALHHAERLPADLIVVGSHGRTGVRRLSLGSVSEALVRNADVPVMTIRSRHHTGCEAVSCETCRSGGLDAMLQADAEVDG